MYSHTADLAAFSFFFNAPPNTEIYTLSLHDALPILAGSLFSFGNTEATMSKNPFSLFPPTNTAYLQSGFTLGGRSEEHTSELQSHVNLVCRLLLEKKKSNSTPALNQHAQSAMVQLSA